MGWRTESVVKASNASPWSFNPTDRCERREGKVRATDQRPVGLADIGREKAEVEEAIDGRFNPLSLARRQICR